MNTNEPDKRSDQADRPEAIQAPDELSDALIQRAFRGFTILALCIFGLGGAILFSRFGGEASTTEGSSGFGLVAERLGVDLQRNIDVPRLRLETNERVIVRPKKVETSSTLELDPASRPYSGGLTLIRGVNNGIELLLLAHWPNGNLSRWRIAEGGVLKEVRFTQERGVKESGWISMATVDINGDGLEDLITAGHGDIGCWLRGRLSGEFLWQADGCGLVVDGDSWVSSIEVLDANQDGRMDLWLNLMSRGPDGWGGKPNELWLYQGSRFKKASEFLNSQPPSRASHSSTLIDIDLDGTLEIVVANLKEPVEIWRQLRRYPFVESREFFGIPELPNSGQFLEYQGDGHREFIAVSGNQLQRMSFKKPTSVGEKPLDLGSLALSIPGLRQILKWDYDLNGVEELLLLGKCSQSTDLACHSRELLRHHGGPERWLAHASSPEFRMGEQIGLSILWDLDLDGYDDLIALGEDSKPEVFINGSDFGHHWFGIRSSENWRHASFEVTRSDGLTFRGVLGPMSQGRTSIAFGRKFGLADGFYISKVRVLHPRLGERVWTEPQPLNSWLVLGD